MMMITAWTYKGVMAFGRGKKAKDSGTAHERVDESNRIAPATDDTGAVGFEEEFRAVWGGDPAMQDEKENGKIPYNLLRREVADTPQPNICFTTFDDDIIILGYHDCVKREIDPKGQVLTLSFNMGDIVTCEGEGLIALREALQQNRVKHLYRFHPMKHELEDAANGVHISKVTVGDATG